MTNQNSGRRRVGPGISVTLTDDQRAWIERQIPPGGSFAAVLRQIVQTAMDARARADFVAAFPTAAQAIEAEERALASPGLPPCAQRVRDGGEPGAEYWRWLLDQPRGD